MGVAKAHKIGRGERYCEGDFLCIEKRSKNRCGVVLGHIVRGGVVLAHSGNPPLVL